MSIFEKLPGLPGTGSLPEQFSPTRSGTHRECFVVKFFPDRGKPWVGNFQHGHLSFDGAYQHPNNQHVLVVSHGEGYVIDPQTKELVELAGGGIKSVHVLDDPRLLLLISDIAFEVLGPTGRLWHTRRLSWDGFRNLKIADPEITGEGWNALDQLWQPFKVDIRTGRSEGGAYDRNDAGDYEKLAR
jgi:hypothetical protein